MSRIGDPMHVAFVITRGDAVGGATVHVRDMARYLMDQGHRATVLIGASPSGDAIAEMLCHHIACRAPIAQPSAATFCSGALISPAVSESTCLAAHSAGLNLDAYRQGRHRRPAWPSACRGNPRYLSRRTEIGHHQSDRISGCERPRLPCRRALRRTHGLHHRERLQKPDAN